MSPDHQTSERVYRALKHDLLEGCLGEERLVIPWLEARYHTSATPVREALLRLVGEQLIVMRPTGGFAAKRVVEAEARHLYEFSAGILLQAMGWHQNMPASFDPGRAVNGLNPPIDALFCAVAVATGNSVVTATMDALNDRLHGLRRAEQQVLTGLEREFSTLRAALLGERDRTARRLVTSYHRRRLRHLIAILRAR